MPFTSRRHLSSSPRFSHLDARPWQRRLPSLAAAFLLVAAGALLIPRALRAQDDTTANPTGSTGDFNGEVTTGGGYDPFTGNAKRAITDIVVPGTAGAYPLAFTRVSNSRQTATDPRENVCFGDGANWRHSYQWFIYRFNNGDANPPVWMVVYPDGSATKFKRGRESAPPSETYLRGPAGTSDRLETNDASNPGYFVLHTSDGGQVHFRGGIGYGNYGANFVPDFITDPFNQTTQIEYDGASSRVNKITEPAGHCLQFYYDTYYYNGRPWVVLGKVRGYTPYGAITSDVGYTYDLYGSDGQNPYLVLTHVFYYNEASTQPGNAVTAFYYHGPYNGSVPGGKPLLLNCYDPHYAGPMANIRYVFNGDPNLPWGTVASEGRAVPGQPTVYAEVVSTLISPGPDSGENRGDGPHRDFHYGQASNPIDATNANPYQITSASDFQSGWTYYAYNGRGDPRGQGYRNAVRDPKGNVTSFDTEPLTGKTTRVRNPDGTTRTFAYTDSNQPYYLLRVTDERNQPTTYNRDGNHLVRSIDYPDGSHEYFDYEDVDIGHGAFHRLTRHVTRRAAVISYFYGDGYRTALPTQITRPHANNNNGGYESTFLSYDNDNADRVRTAWTSRPGGPVETTDYDGFNRVRRVTHADGSYAELGRDDYGNVLTQRDELGHVTTAFYDDYRRPYYIQAPVDQANGIYRVMQYDYNHYGVGGSHYQHTTANFGQAILPSGRALDMLYSGNWWPVERLDAYGTGDQSITYFGYDPAGNRTAVNQQVGPNSWRQTNSDYDARNRLWHTYEPNGAVTTYGYDNAGNLARVDLPADPNPRTIFFAADQGDPNNVDDDRNYDRMNRRRWTKDPKGQTVTMDYDAGGQLSRLTDANGSTTFEYDLLGRKKKTTYPDSSAERWAYDAGGNVAQFQNRAGTVQFMRPYDSRNRPGGWDWNDGTTSPCGFAYDAVGRVTVADNWHSHVEFTYNDAGEVTRELQNVGPSVSQTVSYDRDAAGRIMGMRYPYGGYLRFGYNGREQVANISLDGSGVLASYDYKADGARRWRALLNGTVTDTDHYDRTGRLTLSNDVQVNTSPYHTIARRDYGYTPTHKLSWMVKYAESNNPDENGRGNAYLYDAADQLQTAYLDAINVQGALDGNENSYAGPLGDPHRFGDYRYDAAGNRTYANETNAVSTYTPDGANRLSGFGYDAIGDLNYYPGGARAGNWNLGYNAQGQLRTVTGADRDGVGHSCAFYYDALGRCVARYLDGGSAYLYYDLAGNVLEERDGATNFRYAFVHGPGSDELVCRLGSGPTLWYHQDALGDVAAISGDGGNVLERYAYDAYGQPYVRDAAGWPRAGNQSAYGNRVLAKGRDWLGEVGLYDNRARHYSPSLGRFLQPDPAGFGASGTNLYAYCGNDPVNGSDPSGLWDGKAPIRPEQAAPGGGNFSSGSTWTPWSGYGYSSGYSGPGWDGYWGLDRNGWSWTDDRNFAPGNEHTTFGPADANDPPTANGSRVGGGGFGAGDSIGGGRGGGGGDGGGGGGGGAPSVAAQIGSGLMRGFFMMVPIGQGLLLSHEAMDNVHVGTGGWIESVTELGFGLGMGLAEGGLTSFEMNLCFPAGTPIHTTAGEVPIESVRPGDWVLAQREEGSSGQPEWRQVSRLFRHMAEAGLVAITAGEETVRATPEHPFWVVGRGWRPARELRAGERLLTEEGREVNVEAVSAEPGRTEEVFNFEVEGLHTYFVGHQHLLVHNACAPVNVTSAGRSIGRALTTGERFVGPGYREIGNPGSGVFRSADGLKQFRMTNSDITGAHGNIGPHVHFETLNPNNEVIKNIHTPIW